MARIEPVKEPTADQAKLLEDSLGAHGRPLNLFATLAHHPRLLRRFMQFGSLLLQRNSVPDIDREVVILRIAALTQCDYIVFQHRDIARACGMSDTDIEAVLVERLDRSDALVGAVDEMYASDRITDVTWSVLVSRYSTAQVMELLFLIGFYRMLSGFIRSVDMEIDVNPVPVSAAVPRRTEPTASVRGGAR